MADQVLVDNGDETDYTVSTDDAGASGHVQRVKLALSADGSAAHATVDADGVLVNLGTNNDVTVTGTVAVTQSGTWDEVGINDSGNSITVDDGNSSLTVDGTVGVSGTVIVDGSGVTQPISHAALTELAAAIDTEVQVDIVSSALPTGAATAANQSTIIGHVDGIEGLLTTIDADTGGILTAVQTLDNAISGNEMQVDVVTMPTVAVTQSGTWDEVGINDSGNSITVDAPVGTPVFVRLSDGSSAITTLPVSLASVPSHAVTNAGTFAVQVDGAALTALQLIDDMVFTDDAGFTPGTSKVSVAGFQADEASTDSVDEGDAGAARMTLDRKVIVQPQPHTSGGLSIFRSLDLDETEEDVKTSAGQVYGWYIANLATTTRFVKFYNATAANVTVGSTAPVLTLPIPGNSSDDVAANALGGMGIAFDTAISVAATTGVADADTGAPSANDVVINIFYK